MNIQSKLSSELTISRIITGLWQIADMERTGDLDPKKYAKKIIPYVEAGFTTVSYTHLTLPTILLV